MTHAGGGAFRFVARYPWIGIRGMYSVLCATRQTIPGGGRGEYPREYAQYRGERITDNGQPTTSEIAAVRAFSVIR